MKLKYHFESAVTQNQQAPNVHFFSLRGLVKSKVMNFFFITYTTTYFDQVIHLKLLKFATHATDTKSPNELFTLPTGLRFFLGLFNVILELVSNFVPIAALLNKQVCK